MDREGQLEADQVGVLHRAERGEPWAEAVLDHGVDRLRVADPFVDELEGFAPERVLEPVADEAGLVEADPDRDLADRGEKVEGALDRVVFGALAADHFDQRHQVGRVPPVGPDGAAGVLNAGEDLGRADRRGVRGEDGAGGGDRVEAGEDLPLQSQVLGRGLEDEARAGERALGTSLEADAGQGLGVGAHRLEGTGDPLRSRGKGLGDRVVDGDLVARRGEAGGDPRAHQAAADDGHGDGSLGRAQARRAALLHRATQYTTAEEPPFCIYLLATAEALGKRRCPQNPGTARRIEMAKVEKVLVVGAGIGGLAAAAALGQRGAEVDLIEIKPDSTVYGVGINQPANSLRALDKIGVLEQILDVGVTYDGYTFNDYKGKEIVAITSQLGDERVPPNCALPRRELSRILIGAAEGAGAKIRYGTSIEDLDDRGDGVSVTFNDGSSADYDLVVGFDGIKSPLRARLFGDEYPPVYSGHVVWRLTVPRPAHSIAPTSSSRPARRAATSR